MATSDAAFSLRWKILAWCCVNLAVLGSALFLFLRLEFHVGIGSLLAGPTDARLEAIARPLAADLREHPAATWSATLDRVISPWRARGLRAALYRDDGHFLAGDFRTLPAEVQQTLARHEPPRPPHGGRGSSGPPGMHRPPPSGDDAPPGSFMDWMGGPGDAPHEPPHGPGDFPPPSPSPPPAALEKFMLAADSPRRYWAGVFLGEMRHLEEHGPPSRVTLLLTSDSLAGGGLFFDYSPWLMLGGSLLLISVLLWLPFVHGLTRALARMTHTAEEIAQGHFESPPVSRRRDELGRLNRALSNMAARLDGFVTGQKRFLGDTAHELLSPLARLEVSLSILERHAGADGGQRYVVRALDEVHHISALVQDLLSFTKAELQQGTAELQSVPLADMARQAVAQESAGDKVSLDVADDLWVCAEPTLLVRALANGVRNAVRYAGDAGPINIVAKPVEEDGARAVTVSVLDHGPGVPPGNLDRLFDPFFRPETARTRETGGVGLGLAIVKSCVEACGGRVAVRNRAPSGLELIFTLQRTA